MKTIRLYMMLMLAPVLYGCGTKVSPELEQAKDVIAHFVVPMQLSNSMFAAAHPECKPSQFVRYILSDAGAAELPESEGSARVGDKEESRATGMPLWPAGVAMVADHPDENQKKQIVLKSDDTKNLLIIEVYDDPKSEPAARYELVIEKVQPTEMARLSFQSNAEMGMRFGER